MREILRSLRERDVAYLRRVFADDFTFSDPAGPVVGKEEWLHDLATGALVFDEIVPGEIDLKQTGETVRVIGDVDFKARYAKSNYNGSFRYIGVYARFKGEWKLLLTAMDRTNYTVN